jgi:hypothetical protein
MRSNKKDDFVNMRDALSDFKSQNKLKKGFENADIKLAWQEVMGPGVNNYTTGIFFRAGTLTINLSSSVLRQELLYGRSKIVSNLNEHLKQDLVTKLVLR